MTTLPISLNGYTAVPNDKVAYVVTFLEMLTAPATPAGPRLGVTFERWSPVDPGAYRALYRSIGEEWLWFSRLKMPEAALATLLSAPATEVYAPVREGQRLGLLEFNTRTAGEIEISFFGLLPEAIGGGLGRWLMMKGLELAWARPGTRRVWLHTCTGDSPQAIHFYQTCGFKPYKRAIEIADDPRGQGVLSPQAARHVPYLGEAESG